MGAVWLNRFKRLASGRTDVWLYSLRARLRGLDLGRVSVEELGLSPERSVFHDNSGGPGLARVLATVAIPPDSVALDYGSGKGGAVLTLCQFPFREVIGVELSADLVRIAEVNAARAGVRQARFVSADASQFTDLDRVTHVYMYHPFRCTVVAQVMENIRLSLARRPREITLIYKNPVCHDTIVASRVFELRRTIRDEDSPSSCSLFHLYASAV